MRCASILGCFLLLAGNGAADEVDDLSAALTSGRWVKNLSGNPKVRDRYVYTFAKDGTYKSVLITDHTPPTTTGQWQLVKGKDGKVHLRLRNQKKDYYWLGEDSVIRYDKAKDLLLVSGERYFGEQPIRHEKAK